MQKYCYFINYVDLDAVIPKGDIWRAFLLYLLRAVSTTASWHKYVKRVSTQLPFMALKINIDT